MITKVSTVSLFVTDQDAAKKFYTEKLGFEVRMDAPFGEGGRWLAVAPPGAQTEVVLYQPDEGWQHYAQVVGSMQAMTFEVDDMDATVAALKEKGVAFAQEPWQEPYAKFASIKDHEGNMLLLVEQSAPPQ